MKLLERNKGPALRLGAAPRKQTLSLAVRKDGEGEDAASAVGKQTLALQDSPWQGSDPIEARVGVLPSRLLSDTLR